MNVKQLSLSLLLWLAGVGMAHGAVRLPHILGDHMVLQRETKANLWGWADARHKVTVTCSWNEKTYTTKANSKGEWLVAVDTPEAGGPYDIVISDGEELKVTDVLIGEVWVCSGQSNMEMPVGGYGGGQYAENAQDYIIKANPKRPLRIAMVEKQYNVVPQADCNTRWETYNPTSVANCSATAFFFADYLQSVLNIPVGIMVSAWGGSAIEAWMDRPSIDKVKPDVNYDFLKDPSKIRGKEGTPTILYNGMLYPLHNYTLRGAIWYQGESNRGRYDIYAELQKNMVELWRKVFKNPDMPFYYVEIAPFEYDDPDGNASGYFREAQAKCMDILGNCGMVSTVDVGELKCIHPAKKNVVGKRLALRALGQTYKMPLEYQTPTYDHMEVQGGRAIVYFKNVPHVDDGLHHEPGKFAPVEGFEIAGEDRIFYKADATLEGNCKMVYVSSPKVPKPVAVRYCFRNYQPGYLLNNLGMPLCAFRTDNWEKDTKR